MEITKGLVNFLVETTLDDVPEVEVYRAKELMLNTIGAALEGSVYHPGDLVIDHIRHLGGNPQATVWGKNFKTSTHNAALANGTSAHTWDYDDTTFVWLAHPSASIVPSVLALAEELGASGRDVLEAYILGYETGTKLARGFQVKVANGFMPLQYLRGWHTTGTLGIICCAAACAKLVRLGRQETARAFGIAGSLAGALRANLHTETNPLHCGVAAMQGIMAAELAKQGLTASSTIFDDVYGYCDVMVGNDNVQAEAIEEALESATFSFIDPGFAIKIYPGATIYFAAVQSIIEMVKEHDIKPDQVESIDCGMTAAGPDVARIEDPRTGRDAMYSIIYPVAVSAVDREVGIRQFTDERVLDPVVRDMMNRVKIYVHPELKDVDSHDVAACHVTIKLKDGQQFSKFRSRPKGSPGPEPLTHPELLDKYRECAGFVLPKHNIDRSIELVGRLETVPHISELMGVLSA